MILSIPALPSYRKSQLLFRLLRKSFYIHTWFQTFTVVFPPPVHEWHSAKAIQFLCPDNYCIQFPEVLHQQLHALLLLFHPSECHHCTLIARQSYHFCTSTSDRAVSSQLAGQRSNFKIHFRVRFLGPHLTPSKIKFPKNHPEIEIYLQDRNLGSTFGNQYLGRNKESRISQRKELTSIATQKS